jgi:hypothetical protein
VSGPDVLKNASEREMRKEEKECEKVQEKDTRGQGFAKQGFRYPSTQQNTPSNECNGVENHCVMVQASH